MGKIKKGILGGFSGRVGNVIGASWKGIDYMRSEATSISDPKTTKQLAQRSKFKTCVDFAKICVPLINVGLKQYATKRSEFNYFLSKLIKDYWDVDDDRIFFPSVQLSSGVLEGCVIDDVYDDEIEGVNYVSVGFDSDPGSNPDDLVLCMLYNRNTKAYALNNLDDAPLRSSGTVSMKTNLSAAVSGLSVYLFFVDPVTHDCSPTCYYYT